ncbi:MAG TPA: hypothetical protein VKG43_09935 [Acidimicrobiales bacterium]|nr:hypothetical protein [Acidimicrobiales bacterium]
MAGQLPAGYPHRLSDDELRAALVELSEQLNGADINDTVRLSPLITAGQLELEGRLNDRAATNLQSAILQLHDAVQDFKSSSKTTSYRLIAVTWILVGLTVLLAIETIVLIVDH